MHVATRLLSITVILALVFGGFTATPAAPSVPWQSKVDPWVLQTAAESQTEFLVFFTEQADLSPAAGLATKLEKGTFVFETLTEVANRTQPAVIADLKARGVQYRPFWVANMIWVRGGADVVQVMAARSDIAHVYANPRVKLDLPEVAPGSDTTASPEAIEWNINWVNAPDVWAAGFTGQDVVVAGQDTGYDWDHPALINQYRGWDGGSADHNYNWHDAIHVGGSNCGADSPEPCDDSQHGTHTMGTIVGDDGGANQIGMAPGARWIGCRNMDEGVGTPDTYAECYQWFIAPTDLNDQNPDPSKAPHAINNSWGCPVSEGCTDPNVLLTVVNNVRAAGILTNHSAGNSGDDCFTVNEPAAIYDASFTVGATDSSDNIASFSSRGPVTVDGSGRMKPDISAPGVNIRSSVPGGGYEGGWKGTSMAGPHVTGLVALLISANPGLAGQVDTLETVIEQSAVPRTTNQGCGGDGANDVPNNVYGWGRIDALAAFESVYQDFALTKSASAETVFPGEVFTYTITLTNSSPAFSATNVVLTDTLPANTTFITATQPYTLSGDMLTWTAPSLLPGGVLTVQLAMRVPVVFTGSVVNENYGFQSDEVSAVAGLPVVTKIHALDLVKTASTEELVSSGERITYTLTVTNLHPISTTHNLVLTDTLPVDTAFITATQTYTFSDDMVTWTTPSLDPGKSWTVQLVVGVRPEVSGSIVNDEYYVTSDEVVEPIYGAPVIIPFKTTVYLPEIFNGANAD